MKYNTNSTRLRMIYIMQYLVLNTDKDHPASASDIIKYLEEFNVPAERKAIYRSVATLNQAGIEISKTKNAFYYTPNKGDVFHAFANSEL